MIVLQKFGFKESRYERPQDAWVCGRLAEGKPCELGPSLDGRCCVTTVCQPRLENDRWYCRRSASAGGPCDAGPLPDGQCCMTLERCVPRPSLRTRRKRSTLAALALTVGVLAVAMGGEGGRYFMMPNKLSAPHAGLTDCSTCHAGARSGQVDLLHRLFTAVEPRQNSNLCVTCHVMGANPFTAHTHPVEDLKRLTEKLRSDSKNWPVQSVMQRVAFPSAARSLGADAEIQCATCHKEHQGVFADLKAVSNQRCQTCHVSKFGSFADSHPQFAKFPYHRRPRIAFDHQSHMGKYFPEAVKAPAAGQVAPADCGDCHQLGVRKRYMVVKSFAPMCSGCHTGDITGVTQVSGPKGIGVIAVPGLDVKTLSGRGIDVGYWPDSDATLTPFMKLLLGSNGENVISTVAGLDLFDLRRASDRDLARVAALAWAIKRLFNHLETTNPAAAMTPTGDKPGRQVDALQMAAMTGSMSHDVITAANSEWFKGHLQDDLERHDRGEPTSGFTPPPKPMPGAANSPPAPAAESKAAAMTKPPSAASSDDILSPGGNTVSNKDDILGPDKKDGAPTPTNKDAPAPSKADDILAPAPSKDDILSGNKPSADNALSQIGDGSAAPDEQKTSQGIKAKNLPGTAPARFDPEVWAQTGGWYREDFTIRYHPAGHADQFLQTWLDFAGRAYGTGHELAPIFDELAAKDAVGRCTKCHSVDEAAGARIVNWRPFDANAINNRFTNYSHKPHVELIGTKTCVRCHELQQTDSFLKTYEDGDPVNYTPNFKYVDKALCATCHSQQTEWENCTLCHGYHVPDVTSGSSLPVVPDRAAVPAIAAALPSLNPETEAGQEYAKADKTGTEQAWDDFIATHPSGHYHDLAVQRIAELSRAAPEKSATFVPEKSKPVTPGDLATVAPDKPAATPDKPMNDSSPAPDKSTTAAPGKLATVTPQDSAPTTPANPADSADTGDPTDLDGFHRRGLQRALRGDFALAVEDFDEVVRRDPKNALALNDRCWVRALLDETQAALKDCNASLQAAPNLPDALDSRGLVNLKLGFYKRAIADYTAALSQIRGLSRASALYGRGIAKRRSGNAAGAKADIDIARVYNPSIADEFAKYGIQ